MRSSLAMVVGLLLVPAVGAQELVAHWTMDALVDGVVPDATGKGHDARLGPDGVTPPEVVKGRVSDALLFEAGKQHFLEVADCPDLSFAEPFTAMAWIKPTRRDAAFAIACLKGDRSGDPPWPGWRLRFAWTRVALQVGTPDGEEPQAASEEWSVPAGFWSHVAATWDGERLRVFVNAVEQGSTDFAGEIAKQSPRRALVLGNYIGRKDAYAFDGCLDDIRLYHGALSQDQIFAAARGL